jgi:hypothetical protein
MYLSILNLPIERALRTTNKALWLVDVPYESKTIAESFLDLDHCTNERLCNDPSRTRKVGVGCCINVLH